MNTKTELTQETIRVKTQIKVVKWQVEWLQIIIQEEALREKQLSIVFCQEVKDHDAYKV